MPTTAHRRTVRHQTPRQSESGIEGKVGAVALVPRPVVGMMRCYYCCRMCPVTDWSSSAPTPRAFSCSSRWVGLFGVLKR